jgi:hypothetical protein
MSNGETNARDQRVIDAYRAASENLDERPRAETRAAILAAAARAVDAQPHDADTGATSRRTRMREGMKRIAPSKRPLALVASFLVATVAIVLATQTERQQENNVVASVATEAAPVAKQAAEGQGMLTQYEAKELDVKREANGPTTTLATAGETMKEKADKSEKSDKAAKVQRTEPAPSVRGPNERSQPKAPTGKDSPASPSMRDAPATSTAPPAPPVPPAPAAPQVQPLPPVPAPPAATPPGPEKPKQPSSSTAPERRAAPTQLAESKAAETYQMRERAAELSSPTRPAGALANDSRADVVAAAVAPPPPAAQAAAPPPRAEERANAAGTRQQPAARADQDAAASSDKLAKARPVERTAAVAVDFVEADPARWMDRIVALRDAGRDDDADRELARLRERYPDHKVPPNALRRTGTR